MDRRRFLATSLAASCAALAAPPLCTAQSRQRQLRLTLHPEKPGNVIAADFTGLSYETSQLSDPTFFSADNAALAAFHRRLGTSGVLRIGGNTSEFGVWTPKAPTHSTPEAFGPDTGRQRRPAVR